MRPLLRLIATASLALTLVSATGCGYHTLGAATHLPPDVQTLAVPVFATRTEANGTETAMTEAVIREFITRTRFRVTHGRGRRCRRGAARHDPQADRYAAHLQHRHAAVVELPHHHRGLRHAHRAATAAFSTRTRTTSYREQYQSTTDLPTFIQEDPAAIQRLSREFARQLVADVLEGL